MNNRKRNKRVSDQEYIESEMWKDNFGIIVLVVGVFFIVFGLFAYTHPLHNYSVASNISVSFGIIIIGFSMFTLFISDLWFVGKRFDKVYRDKVLSVYKKDEERTKRPVPFFMAGLRPYRTLMYTRAIMMPRLSKKRSIFKESLKEEASVLDIFFAWTTYFFIVLGFALLIIGAVLS